MELVRKLQQLGACDAALLWAWEKTLSEAWRDCDNPDWIMWFYSKTNPEKTVRYKRAMLACCKLVEDLMNDSLKKALGVAEANIEKADYAAIDEEYRRVGRPIPGKPLSRVEMALTELVLNMLNIDNAAHRVLHGTVHILIIAKDMSLGDSERLVSEVLKRELGEPRFEGTNIVWSKGGDER